MVGMTLGESTEYAASFDHVESKGYAEEYRDEVEAEVNDIVDGIINKILAEEG